VRQVFSGDTGAGLLKILRKVFLPTFDVNAGIGEQADIFWLDLKDLGRMAPADRETAILSRVKTIEFLEQGLERLHVVAGTTLSPVQMDSVK